MPSPFVAWTNKFVDPAAAFAYGWASWFGAPIGVANELSVWKDRLSNDSYAEPQTGTGHSRRVLGEQ